MCFFSFVEEVCEFMEIGVCGWRGIDDDDDDDVLTRRC